MIPQELTTLRQQMYEAHQAFVSAMAEYEELVFQRRPTPAAVAACVAAGRSLDETLDALIHYLRTMEPDPDREAERLRATTLKRTLSRELGLVQRSA